MPAAARCPRTARTSASAPSRRLHSGRRPAVRDPQPRSRSPAGSAPARRRSSPGLMAADHLYELALDREEIYRRAVELEGHPDNVAAALYGGFVALPAGRGRRAAGAGPAGPSRGRRGGARDPRRGGARPRRRGRRCPPRCPLADAVANVAAASQLVLGHRALRPGPDRARARRPPAPAPPRRPLPALDGAARRGAATWARSAPRSRAPGRPCWSGASGRTPARSPRP